VSIADLAAAHAGEVEHLVDSLGEATSGLAAGLARLSAAATAGWVALAGSVGAVPAAPLVAVFLAGVRRDLAALFAAAGPVAERVLGAAVRTAVGLGARQASAEVAELSGSRPRPPVPALSAAVLAALAKAGEHLAAQRAGALRVMAAAPSAGFPAVLGGLREARKAVGLVDRAGSWAVARAVADGSRSVADRLGVGRVWVPERTACVVCAKYAGEVAARGGGFPLGLTFGAVPTDREPVPDPPRHPHCRCRTTPWSPDWATPGVLSFPEALKREAERSIAKGFALPSEPAPVRVAAAERLLATGPNLPASVLAFAARAVRSGEFPPVPAGI
jgi:hypothetical protein